MNDLKLLLTTYSSAFLTSGGGESEMVQLAELLEHSGCRADLYGAGSRPLSYYDAVMHFSVGQDGETVLRAASAAGKKIFLWPNVWWSQPPAVEEVKRIRQLVGSANCLLFKSEFERDHFLSHVGEISVHHYVVPTSISEVFFQVPDMQLARTVCEVTNYVLCIGLIEPIKNQLELIRALNTLKIDGLFIGGFRDVNYNKKCMEEANPRVNFLPFLQPRSALLRSVIANAAIVAEPSFDPPGRSCIEGAMARKPLVLLDSLWAREHFDDSPYYADNGNATDLSKAIHSAYHDKRDTTRTEQAYNRVLKKHSAPSAIQALINILIRELF